MSRRVKKVTIEIPHRISGFFEIVDKFEGIDIEDPIKIGSRGAGFCLNAKGKTKITSQGLKRDMDWDVEIYINGKKFDKKAETTYYIFEFLKKYIQNPCKIRIDHSFELPVGCGYGASGSGALGTIFGLDYLFDLKLTKQEKAKIAHIAEVVNRTGLGTVCGQLGGGFGVLKEPGFPCTYERIKAPRNLRIICSSFGPIHTKSILTDPVLNFKIKEAGKKALKQLLLEPNIKKFISVSRDFVRKTEILDILDLTEIKELLKSLNRLDIIGSSMNQLGRSVYSICRKENESDVLDILESYKPNVEVFITSIHEKKSIIFKKN